MVWYNLENIFLIFWFDFKTVLISRDLVRAFPKFLLRALLPLSPEEEHLHLEQEAVFLLRRNILILEGIFFWERIFFFFGGLGAGGGVLSSQEKKLLDSTDQLLGDSEVTLGLLGCHFLSLSHLLLYRIWLSFSFKINTLNLRSVSIRFHSQPWFKSNISQLSSPALTKLCVIDWLLLGGDSISDVVVDRFLHSFVRLEPTVSKSLFRAPPWITDTPM